MNEAKIILETAIGKIKNLMAENKFAEAHRGCLEILRFDPDNIKVIKLKNKIEREVKNHNIKALKEDISNLQPLLETGNFEELLLHLKQLEPYINQYEPLKKFIIKAQKAYKKDVEGKQHAYFEQRRNEIEVFQKQNKFSEAIDIAQKMLREGVEKNKTELMLTKLKADWIDYELKRGQPFMESEKYEDILLWLQKIKQISGQNKKLNVMIEKVKKRQTHYNLDQKKDFIFTGKEKIKTLLQLKKFDKAALAAEEILNIDPTNSAVRKMFIESTRKEMKKMNKALIKQIKESHKKMKEQYAQNKQDFIHL